MIKELSEKIVTEITAMGQWAGTDVIVDRAYHENDEIAADKIVVDVYPLTRQKEREGNKTKIITASFYLAIQRKLKPKDRDGIDSMVEYVEALDAHFEGLGNLDVGGGDGATYIVNDDETFLWFPEQLNKQNKFVSLIELRYRWKTLLGAI